MKRRMVLVVGLSLAMGIVSCAPVGAPDGSLPRAEQAAPDEYEQLLRRYATRSGVRYEAWKKNREDLAKLERVVGFYGDSRPPEGREAALAWYLNAYNAGMLRAVLDKYPTAGVLAGDPHFFQTTKMLVAGREVSFDMLEQDIIRPAFDEPRLHFALNCASASCPPLHTAPLEGPTLEATLEMLTRRFVNDNPRGVQVEGGTIRVSKIFEWYAEDFGGEAGLREFLRRYRRGPVPENLAYLEYDWSLNRAR